MLIAKFPTPLELRFSDGIRTIVLPWSFTFIIFTRRNLQNAGKTSSIVDSELSLLIWNLDIENAYMYEEFYLIALENNLNTHCSFECNNLGIADVLNI